MAGIVRDLALLVRVSTSVNSVRETSELQRELLRLVFEAVPAERGAILLVGDDGRVVSEFGLDRAGDASRTVEVSRTICGRFWRRGRPCSRATSSRVASTGESLRAAHLSSPPCVPLVLYGRALGAVYLTAADPSTHFDEGHLQLVTAICSIAAVALNNARHVEQLESENDLLRAESTSSTTWSARARPMHARLPVHRARRADRLDRADSRRDRHGQGAGRARDPPRTARARPRLRRHQLRGAAETLLECELFGHESGAFTGARRAEEGQARSGRRRHALPRRGRRDAARLQAKLLRVLQEREFERVGGTRTIRWTSASSRRPTATWRRR